MTNPIRHGGGLSLSATYLPLLCGGDGLASGPLQRGCAERRAPAPATDESPFCTSMFADGVLMEAAHPCSACSLTCGCDVWISSHSSTRFRSCYRGGN